MSLVWGKEVPRAIDWGIGCVAGRKDVRGAPHWEGAQMEFFGFECADTIMGSVLWAGTADRKKVKPEELLAE